MLAFFRDKLNILKTKFRKAHKSFTIWLNGMAGLLVVVIPYAQDQWQILHGIVGETFYHGMVVLLVVGNILLRFKTTKSLADK